MIFLSDFIFLFSHFFENFFDLFFVPLICLSFLATIPYMIRALIKWR